MISIAAQLSITEWFEFEVFRQEMTAETLDADLIWYIPNHDEVKSAWSLCTE